MNVERESKVTIAVTFKELIAALQKQFPTEFLLNGFPTDPKLLSVERLGTGIALTGVRRTQGAAEIDFNRLQRAHQLDDDGA